MSTAISNAKEPANNDGEITLTATKDDTRHIGHEQDVEPDKAGTPRSIIVQPAYAYLYNNVVMLVSMKTLQLSMSLSPMNLPVKRSIQRHVVTLLPLI